MNDRERILAILSGRRPDRVPWFGDLAYWAAALRAQGKLPEKEPGAAGYIEWHRRLGVGYYLQGYFPFRTTYDSGVRVREERAGHVTRRVLETPVGRLEEEHTYLPESYTSAPTRHLVRSPEDLRVLRYVLEHTVYQPDYEEARLRAANVGGAGVALCYLPKSPFMHMVALLAGIETVVGLACDAPEEFAATLEVMEARHDEAAALAVASPAECLMIPENLSAEVVGPDFFERHMRRYQEKWTRRIREAGKFSFIHMDGRLRGLLREEGSVGFTVLEALTPEPIGDVPIGELRELAGPGPILWGGLPGSYFTPLVSEAEFERHVIEVLGVCRRDGRMVLGVADQVPPDGLESRVRLVAELAEEHGRYA